MATMKRSLTAILFADAVGYSRHMRASEQLAVRSIVHHISAIRQLIATTGGEHRGGAGDSVLATFNSVRDAVRCARAIQARAPAPDDLLDIQFRIGIHLGDMVEVDGDLHGDSVNIAARLEPIAPPGGICVSRSVYDALRGEADFAFVSIGRPKLKHMGEDLEVFTVVDAAAAGLSAPGLALAARSMDPNQPSIAVLPFECMSDRDDLAALASGFSDEVIGYLTRFSSLDVIARGSSIFGGSDSPDTGEKIARLNVRYVVQGRVQLSTRRIRVKVRLINVESRRALWSEQYDRVFDDIFDVQEDIAECAVAAMSVQIEEIERKLARARNPDSLDAYALQLRARDEIFLNEAQARLRALELAERAIAMSPDYARPYATKSRALSLGWKYSWSEDPEASFSEAHDEAMRAVAIDGNDPKGLAELGWMALFRREHDRSLAAFSRALELNPSDADILGEYADALKHSGQKDESIPLFQRAMRLNPIHRDRYARDLAHALMLNRDFEGAVDTINAMVDPTQALRVLTASYSHLGQHDLARQNAELLKARHPEFSAKRWAKIVPDRDPADTELLVEGLELAGL